MSLDVTNRSVKQLQRMRVGSAREVTLDKRFRFPVPHHLLEYAGITMDVTIISIRDSEACLGDTSRWNLLRADNTLIRRLLEPQGAY